MARRGPFREFTAMFVAVSMLGSSAASAAAPVAQSIDPLVALSVFGTAQSRAAVCAAGSNAAAAAGAAMATQAAGPGCVLPVVDAPPAAAAVAPPPPPAEVALAPAAVTGGPNILPLLLGLAAIAAIAAVVIKHNDSSGEINLPISP